MHGHSTNETPVQTAIDVIEIDRDETVNNLATLSNNPKSLHELWNEYEIGIGNRKAAKDFTRRERGKCKYTYHRRKVLWDMVAQMVRRGWNAQAACSKIYSVYGENSSVTNIINLMRRDKSTGGHPSLQSLFIDNV